MRLGIKMEPPSINRSGVVFDVANATIFYALAALKGVGPAAVEMIIEARGDRPFASLADFASRVPPKALNKRVIESLAAAGAFDTIEPNRARIFAGADAILAACQSQHEAETTGQHSLFGSASDAPTLILPAVEPWLPQEKLQKEYDAIGFFLSGHPLDDYATALKRLRIQSWAEFSRAVRSGATAGKVAATVVSRMERRTKTGNKMGILGLSDPTGHFEAVLFSEGLAQYRDVLEPGAAVCCSSAPSCRARTCARASCMPSCSMPRPPRPRWACASSCATASRSSRSPSGWSSRRAQPRSRRPQNPGRRRSRKRDSTRRTARSRW